MRSYRRFPSATDAGESGMATVVDIHSVVRHKQVFELRYQFGHVFYDKLGRVAADLLSNYEGWSFAQLSSDHATLAHKELNLSFNYGVTTLALSQVQTAEVPELMESSEFAQVADRFAGHVVDAFEVTDFPRAGYRVWELFETSSREKAVELLSRSSLGKDAYGAVKALGRPYDLQLRAEVERENHILRIQIAPAQQQVEIDPATMAKLRAQTFTMDSRVRRQALIDRERARRKVAAFPLNSLLVDLDASVEDPEYPQAFKPVDFIATAWQDMEEVAAVILAVAPEQGKAEA